MKYELSEETVDLMKRATNQSNHLKSRHDADDRMNHIIKSFLLQEGEAGPSSDEMAASEDKRAEVEQKQEQLKADILRK